MNWTGFFSIMRATNVAASISDIFIPLLRLSNPPPEVICSGSSFNKRYREGREIPSRFAARMRARGMPKLR